MVEFLRDRRVLLAGFIIIGMFFYLGYRMSEISTEIDLTEGSINFSIDQYGMVDPDDILLFSRTDTNGNSYQEYELRSGAELRPIDLTEHTESIRSDAQKSYMATYTYDLDPMTNEALYFRTVVDSSDITIEDVTVFSASKSFIKKYEHEPSKTDSYSIFLLATELQANVDGGVYLQYKGFVMEGSNRISVVLSIFIQIIEGS